MKQTKHHLANPTKTQNDYKLTNTNQVKVKAVKTAQSLSKYLLQDYNFLQQYQLIQCSQNSENQFIAKIHDTQQLVRLKKVQYISLQTKKGYDLYHRFQNLVQLFHKGIILADNMFILEQSSTYFYYVIQPYLTCGNNGFITLRQYMFQNGSNLLTFQSKRQIFNKSKLLLDHLSDTHYCGLNSNKFVLDDQNNIYLMPFDLNIQIYNEPYAKSYYPPELLQMCMKNQISKDYSYSKWDIWSYGCITLQIFLYYTPFFLSTTCEKQIQKSKNSMNKIIHQLKKRQLQKVQKSNGFYQNINQQIKYKQNVELITNFIKNSLNFNINQRELSFEQNKKNENLKDNQNKVKVQKLLQNTRKSLSIQNIQDIRIKQQSKSIKQTEQNKFVQLNVCQKPLQQNGYCNFQLKFISLSNIKCDNEIKIKIKFNQHQIFQFFISRKDHFKPNMQNYYIYKKITYKQKTIQFLEDLLIQNVLITLQNQNCDEKYISCIQTNFGALTIVDEGKRAWKKPIIATYQVKNGQFKGAKLKIQCQITSHQSQEIQTYQKLFSKTQTTVLNQKIQNSSLQHEQNNSNKNRVILCTKDKQNGNIKEHIRQIIKPTSKLSSTFTSINNNLDQISNFWKQKLSKQNSSSKKSTILNDLFNIR